MPSPPLAGPAVGFEDRLAEAITNRISPQRYDLWFRDHTKFVLLGDEIVVGVPNLYFHDWLQKTFGDDVRAAATKVVGNGVRVRFAIDPGLFQANRQEQDEATIPPKKRRPTGEEEPIATPRPKAEATGRTAVKAPKRRWRLLNDFVVGQCNRVAYASAVSTVEEPGQGANPLVFYGPTGTGKTHLLEGIYSGIRKRHSDAKAIFLSAEEFMNRFLGSIHHGKQGAFRRQYRECFALLIDDLSFLAGKKATQVEFLHTFDSLLSDGCQIVVTCDCHPRLAEDLMPELTDRLLGGAVWGVLPPDAETRLALLQAKAALGPPPIPEEVLQYLARHLRGNVRELEGAIHSLRHYARVTKSPVTKDLAREALGDLLRHAVKVVRLADVEAAVCSALRLAGGALKSKSKAWSISHARMLAIFLARRHTSATVGEISTYFGNKTHSTAVAAEKRVRAWIDKNTAVRAGDREWKARDLLERVERELMG